MSKFLCLGMPLANVIRSSTIDAAMALKRPELGSLKPGSVGDATLLSIADGTFDYEDSTGEHMTGDKRIHSEGVVLAGKWWHSSTPEKFEPITTS
jgi:dihydroorotase